MAEKSSTGDEANPFVAAMAAEAEEAGLRYADDSKPGITRVRTGKDRGEFEYRDPKGRRITEEPELERIRRLGIPPAWEEVWISPDRRGHIQATGRDARRRKQYRYHERWREQRDQNKFSRLLAFGRALPQIRKKVESDLALPGMPREKVLATVVRLLEVTLIRVGNDEYARQNRSYGLTTIRNRHVKVRGARVSFSFKGKSGKHHVIDVEDRTLAKIVRKSLDLPGEELFAYVDENGNVRDVTSADVNAYLREIAGSEFTAKDFRTWSGTVLTAVALKEFEAVTSQSEAKRNVTTAIKAVARMLGNTPAVCKKCYVHPEVMNSYLEKGTVESLAKRIGRELPQGLRGLKPEEAAVMALIASRAAEQAAKGEGLHP